MFRVLWPNTKAGGHGQRCGTLTASVHIRKIIGCLSVTSVALPCTLTSTCAEHQVGGGHAARMHNRQWTVIKRSGDSSLSIRHAGGMGGGMDGGMEGWTTALSGPWRTLFQVWVHVYFLHSTPAAFPPICHQGANGFYSDGLYFLFFGPLFFLVSINCFGWFLVVLSVCDDLKTREKHHQHQ